jgi:hypothetical protein
MLVLIAKLHRKGANCNKLLAEKLALERRAIAAEAENAKLAAENKKLRQKPKQITDREQVQKTRKSEFTMGNLQHALTNIAVLEGRLSEKQHATRSRAPNTTQRNQHRAGYRSRICLNKRRNTNLARETRTLCPVGRTALSPWV